MTAQELTTAAAKLRQRASEASGPQWVAGGIGDYGWTVHAATFGQDFGVETADSEQGKADAAWIALADPAMGLLWADALDAAAEAWPRTAAHTSTHPMAAQRRALLAVARAVNGNQPTDSAPSSQELDEKTCGDGEPHSEHEWDAFDLTRYYCPGEGQ